MESSCLPSTVSKVVFFSLVCCSLSYDVKDRIFTMLEVVQLKNSISGEKVLFAFYELLYMHEHDFIISPFEKCWGTVLIVGIIVFAHSFNFHHGVHPPSPPKVRSGRCR